MKIRFEIPGVFSFLTVHVEFDEQSSPMETIVKNLSAWLIKKM